MSELIKKIESAKKKSDKQALVKLGADHLGVDLDDTKTTAILAEELLAVIEERGEAGTSEAQTEQAEGKDTQDGGTGDNPESQVDEGEDDGPEPVEEEAPKPRYKGRMLKNRNNGRLFPWTAALAKSRHMQEV